MFNTWHFTTNNTLSIPVRNASDAEDLRIEQVVWTIGDQRGEAPAALVLLPGSEGVLQRRQVFRLPSSNGRV